MIAAILILVHVLAAVVFAAFMIRRNRHVPGCCPNCSGSAFEVTKYCGWRRCAGCGWLWSKSEIGGAS